MHGRVLTRYLLVPGVCRSLGLCRIPKLVEGRLKLSNLHEHLGFTFAAGDL